MSKLKISAVFLVSFVLLVGLSFLYERSITEPLPEAVPELQKREPIVIPEADPNNPKEASCALCAQVPDEASKEQCFADFECS